MKRNVFFTFQTIIGAHGAISDAISGADAGGFKGFHGTPFRRACLTRDTLIEQSQ